MNSNLAVEFSVNKKELSMFKVPISNENLVPCTASTKFQGTKQNP